MAESHDRTSFGARLLKARKQARLSQKQLAERCGIAQSTLSELEKIGAGSSHVLGLAHATGVRAEWLASGTGPMQFTAIDSDATAPGTAEPRPSFAPAPTPLVPNSPSIRYLATLVADKMKGLKESQRETAGAALRSLAMSPADSAAQIEVLVHLLGEIDITRDKARRMT